jgi:hypothetical protein
MSGKSIEERLDRIESIQEIQDMAIRYAIAADSRDIDTWISLFVPDVNCGRFGTGREALRQSIEPLLQSFYRSIHLVCGHTIAFDGPDRATGRAYCRAEHEIGDKWIVVPVLYLDEYARVDGHWYFARRKELHWYATDIVERPIGENLEQWKTLGTAKLPGTLSGWKEFWDRAAPGAVEKVTSRRTS